MKESLNKMLKFIMGDDYEDEIDEKDLPESSYENSTVTEPKRESREEKKTRIPVFQKKEKAAPEEKERTSRYSDSSSRGSYSFGASSRSYDHDSSTRNRSSRVVNMASGNQNTIITSIKEYADCKDIVRQLKEKKAVIINMDQIDKFTAKRAVDFLSGAITAIDGDIKKLSNSIVIVAPNNVKLTGMFGEDIPSNITETLFSND